MAPAVGGRLVLAPVSAGGLAKYENATMLISGGADHQLVGRPANGVLTSQPQQT